jgi:hypothetical protein
MKQSRMVTRTPSGYLQLLQDQYVLLKDSVAGFYAGTAAKANDVAVRIRTLVHSTDKSRALLSFVAPNYLELDIYHRSSRLSEKAVFFLQQPIRITAGGRSAIMRDDFTNPNYKLVPLERWWMDEYLVIGQVRSSKKQIVLDVANKDGGAHVDEEVPARYVAASEPPFIFGANDQFVRPNLARSTVAQAGNELLNYLERHFPSIAEMSKPT